MVEGVGEADGTAVPVAVVVAVVVVVPAKVAVLVAEGTAVALRVGDWVGVAVGETCFAWAALSPPTSRAAAGSASVSAKPTIFLIDAFGFQLSYMQQRSCAIG